MKCLAFIVTVILLVAAATVRAAEYHVAIDGDDANPGTQAEPFATLQRGHDAAAPGDTVFVHGGTYRVAGERVAGVVLSKSGEPDNPIRFFAFADERPVIDCTGLTSPERPVGVKVSGSWVHLKGLEVCHVMAPRGTSYGLWVKDASHTTLERLTLHDNQGPGLFIDGGTGGHLVLSCDSYNNYDPHADTGPGLAASGNGAGFKMGNTFTGVRHVVRNCATIRNPGASDMQHNSWDLGITFTDADFESCSDERFLTPRMPGGGLPGLLEPPLGRTPSSAVIQD